VRRGITPQVHALSALLVFASILGSTFVLLFQKRRAT